MRHFKSLATPVCAAAILATSAIPGNAASDAEVQELRRQLALLTARLEQIEATQAETKAEVAETKAEVKDTKERAVLSTGDSPGSFLIPGTGTTLSIGGYAKADFIYDLDEDTGDLFVPESITTSGNDNNGFGAHARQSRLFVKTSTPTELGALKTHFEGDFFGVGGNQVFSNSASFRIRHAYGEVGGVLAGQFWSNFMPIEIYPSTVDFNGPAGIPFVRQAQLRYTSQISDNLTIAGSLENSEFTGTDGAGNLVGETTGAGALGGLSAGIDVAPDVTLAATWRDDWGLLKVAGVGRLFSSPTSNDEEFGWGVNVSGRVNVWDGGAAVGSFTYGDGVGRYILNGFGQDGTVDAAGNLRTTEAYGVTLGFSQKVTDDVTASLAYGRYEVLDNRNGPSGLESVNTLHATLFWSPIERFTIGAEAIYGDRTDANGADDDAIRLQTSVQFNF